MTQNENTFLNRNWIVTARESEYFVHSLQFAQSKHYWRYARIYAGSGARRATPFVISRFLTRFVVLPTWKDCAQSASTLFSGLHFSCFLFIHFILLFIHFSFFSFCPFTLHHSLIRVCCTTLSFVKMVVKAQLFGAIAATMFARYDIIICFSFICCDFFYWLWPRLSLKTSLYARSSSWTRRGAIALSLPPPPVL